MKFMELQTRLYDLEQRAKPWGGTSLQACARLNGKLVRCETLHWGDAPEDFIQRWFVDGERTSVVFLESTILSKENRNESNA